MRTRMRNVAHLERSWKTPSTNGFAYAKTGDQAAAIGTKGNKRRR
jgi:hypothetical protein